MMPLSAVEVARMSELLDQALPMGAPQRRGWLERIRAQHAELVPALRRSLFPRTGSDPASIEVDTLPRLRDAAGDAQAVPASLKPGERIGPYELVQPLGSGGMAEVWLARRADGAFTRQVALKVPLRSARRPDLVERFGQERDILAGLEHINIARMYDAGLTPEGLPYLAMEYVSGEGLIEWCDNRRLKLRERIKLFLQVLNALQYAHARHIVHRDLKPSNILVTQEGQVRLLDFGVANLMAGPKPRTTDLTRTYGRALTPDYASPELLRGDCVDPTSDIYSLGIVLYELLTGCRPYRFGHTASITQIEQRIETIQIARPSVKVGHDAEWARATSLRRLVHQLCGDLDAIVLKALSRQPQHRYSSVAELADDLSRYLGGEPVEARGERAIHRAGRFVLRHAMGAAGIAAVLATVAFTFACTGVPQVPAMRAESASLGTQSIVVLPFADMSEKGDKGYIAAGIAETIRDLLSQAPQLQVAASTSSSRLQVGQSSTAEIGRALGATHVLEGSVQHAGGRLRINARLVQADGGFVVWSGSYDRALDDSFTTQDEVAGAVAQAVQVSLAPRANPTYANRTEHYALNR